MIHTTELIVSIDLVIDALTGRGAFKGEELSTIGQLRDQCLQSIQLCESYQQEQVTESE
jgi:hypothetical protein